MNFFEHIEDLRWHLVRSIAAWLTAVIAIFVYIDFVYDNIMLAPARETFFTYGALCRFGEWLHLGSSLCMPAMKIDFQITTINGTFNSAINIAMSGGFIAAIPYIFWELWRFVKPALSPKERKYGRKSICEFLSSSLPSQPLAFIYWHLLLLIFWQALHWVTWV